MLLFGETEVNYNQDKRKANVKKHGIAPGQASQAFIDPFAVNAHDPEHSAEEDRPLTDEQLQRFRRLPDVPGGNFLARVRAVSSSNKTLLSVRYDTDVVSFFKGQGKGYQRLMNNVLRAYMEAYQASQHV